MSIIFLAQNLIAHVGKTKPRSYVEEVGLDLARHVLAMNLGQLECRAFLQMAPFADRDEHPEAFESNGYLMIKNQALVAMRGEKLNINAGAVGQVFFEPIALDVPARVESEEG